MSLVEPPISLSETNELVFNSVGAVLMEDFVNGSSESFGVSIRQALVVIEENLSMVDGIVEAFGDLLHCSVSGHSSSEFG